MRRRGAQTTEDSRLQRWSGGSPRPRPACAQRPRQADRQTPTPDPQHQGRRVRAAGTDRTGGAPGQDRRRLSARRSPELVRAPGRWSPLCRAAAHVPPCAELRALGRPGAQDASTMGSGLGGRLPCSRRLQMVLRIRHQSGGNKNKYKPVRYVRLLSFCGAKETPKDMKWRPAGQEKTPANRTSKYINNSRLNSKTQNKQKI